jgi:hypothetical protein
MAPFGKVSWTERIHTMTGLWFFLRLIHEVVGGTVDDVRWPSVIESVCDTRWIRDFHVRMTDRDRLIPKPRHKITPQLTERSNDGDTHNTAFQDVWQHKSTPESDLNASRR